MLLTYPKWSSFTPKPIADAKRENEVMLALSCDSREAVDQITETAGASGGIADISPKDEYDFMYGRSFEDPDGHVWGPFSWICPRCRSRLETSHLQTEARTRVREPAKNQPAPRYESATTHAAAVNTQETVNSPHCAAVIVRANDQRQPHQEREPPICNADKIAAGLANVPVMIATPATR